MCVCVCVCVCVCSFQLDGTTSGLSMNPHLVHALSICEGEVLAPLITEIHATIEVFH